MLQIVVQLFFVKGRFGDHVSLRRPISQVLHAAAFAAERKIRIHAGLDGSLADWTSKFHGNFQIERRIASSQNSQRRASRNSLRGRRHTTPGAVRIGAR